MNTINKPNKINNTSFWQDSKKRNSSLVVFHSGDGEGIYDVMVMSDNKDYSKKNTNW